MSWSIGLIVNNVELTEECADELNALAEENGDEAYAYENALEFIEDHMEHMDYLSSNDDIVAILTKHKVSGIVRFASVEGDNCGSMWEHRFLDGDYSYKHIDLADIAIDHDD